MDDNDLNHILNGLSIEDYIREMNLDHFRLDLGPDTLDTAGDMEQVGRLNTLYGGPEEWPAAILRDLAASAVGVRGLSEGDNLAEIEEATAKEQAELEDEVWAVPYLTAASRADLEAIVAHDEAMPRGEFSRRMMERVKPAPKLRVMPAYIAPETKYGKYDPFFDEQEAWNEYQTYFLDGEARLDVRLDPARAGKLLEAIDDLEARGIKFDRIAPIATGALLKLSELADRGLFEHFAELEPYVPYVDPRSEEGWVYLGDEEGQYSDPEDGEYIDTSSTLYYLPESDRFFLEDSRSYFFGGNDAGGDLTELTREEAFDSIMQYAAGRGEKFASPAAPASIDALDRYSISSSDKALEVIAGLTAEFEPEGAVKTASDGVHDLWHLENIDRYMLAPASDTLEGALDAGSVEAVDEDRARRFRFGVEESLGMEWLPEAMLSTNNVYEGDGIQNGGEPFSLDAIIQSHLLDQTEFAVTPYRMGHVVPVLIPIYPEDEDFTIKRFTFAELCEALKSTPGIVNDGMTSYGQLVEFAEHIYQEERDRDQSLDEIALGKSMEAGCVAPDNNPVEIAAVTLNGQDAL